MGMSYLESDISLPSNHRGITKCATLELDLESQIRIIIAAWCEFCRRDLPCIRVELPDKLDAVSDAVPPLSWILLPHHILLQVQIYYTLHECSTLLKLGQSARSETTSMGDRWRYI
jgi:hypothetical protein